MARRYRVTAFAVLMALVLASAPIGSTTALAATNSAVGTQPATKNTLTTTSTETPQPVGAIYYAQSDQTPAIEVSFSESVQNISGNYELYVDGSQVSTTATNVTINGSRALIQLDEQYTGDMVLRLTEGITNSTGTQVEPQNVSVTYTGRSVTAGVDRVVFQGTPLAIVTNSTDTEVNLRKDGSFIRQLTTGTNSRVAVLETDVLETGDHSLEITGQPDATIDIAQLQLATSLEQSNVLTSDTIRGRIQANVAGRDIQIALRNESGVRIGPKQVVTLGGQGMAGFTIDLSDHDTPAGTYTIELTEPQTTIQSETATVNVTGLENVAPTNVSAQLMSSTATPQPNTTVTVNLVALSPPTDIGTFSTNLSVTNASVATIKNTTITGSPADVDVRTSQANDSVAIDVYGLNRAEAETVTLAELTLRLDTEGSTTVSVSETILGSVNGKEIVVGTQSGTRIRVTNLTPLGDFEHPPADVNGDGRFEDINGDGNVTVSDVQAAFDNRESTVIENNADKFDFSENDRFNIVDIQRLFFELAVQ
ncbi:hypothetical protein [Haloferax profundi]|uniref:Dockerin domain-containing protein n=1 Tax=Haloferax profundi TaxID=1544718 RepID=A0A0W1RXX9_9EURY|nr:hypothetical protein [Haloferax profundi]KTG18255.1 hypothetical protein AUR66_18265 [Haloferax profundi]